VTVRSGSGPTLSHDALDEIKREVMRGRRWVIDADIRGFFDALDRQILLSRSWGSGSPIARC
jgi:retron-type reverse transcriptase